METSAFSLKLQEHKKQKFSHFRNWNRWIFTTVISPRTWTVFPSWLGTKSNQNLSWGQVSISNSAILSPSSHYPWNCHISTAWFSRTSFTYAKYTNLHTSCCLKNSTVNPKLMLEYLTELNEKFFYKII